MENFVEILNDLILDTGLSLRKIAKESGVSATQYGRYLKGYNPSINSAVRIANYFNCSLDYLFGFSEDKGNKSYVDYDMTNFIMRYEESLQKNNITHWKLAKDTDLSESALRHWKYGDTPSMESLIIIASNLSVSLDYLVGRY